MSKQPYLNPVHPNFSINSDIRSNLRTLDDMAGAYTKWGRNSDVFDLVEGQTMRVVGTNVGKLAREPIPNGIYAGKPRYVSKDLAKRLGIKEVPFPDESFSWTNNASVAAMFARIAYYQGSSEFGSSQQQNKLNRYGYSPPILAHYRKHIIIEEGEHGIQMVGWELGEGPKNLGGPLGEDLLARIANSPDRNLQQPLIEFNPEVSTLPEFAHYLDKQDRDGLSQLLCSVESASALYAGMMLFFLRQERRHMLAGEQLINWYLESGKIPMDLHIMMDAEWAARTYRLHGNPLESGNAKLSYQLGIKNPIESLNEPTMEYFEIPHPDGKDGFKRIDVGPNMDREYLNGQAMAYIRNILAKKNEERSKLLTDKQRREMREFLEGITMYVPNKRRREILESGIIPTTQVSWRPSHLASGENDLWPHMRGYYTDIFGHPISTEREYLQYRELVELTEKRRDEIRELTSKPGWMKEDVKPGGKGDIYKSGPVMPRSEDALVYQFTVGGKSTNRKFFTLPQAEKRFENKKKKNKQIEIKGVDGRAFLDSIWEEMVGDDS